jgi:hypothetical protein
MKKTTPSINQINFTFLIILLYFSISCNLQTVALILSFTVLQFSVYTLVKKRKSKIIFLLVFTLLLGHVSFGQTNGDFRSKATGPAEWNTAASWQTYIGGMWVDATTYPGQNSGTYTVTIRTGQNIKISSNFTTPSTFNSLIIYGILDLIGGSNPKQININTKFTCIAGTLAKLNFSSQKTALYLPANSVIEITNGGSITGSCSHNTEIYIGGRLIGVCSGGGGGVSTFGEIQEGGGTLNAVITSPTSNPYLATRNQFITPTGSYTGTPTSGEGVTYEWKIQYPDESAPKTYTSQIIPATKLTKVGNYLFSFSVITQVSGSPYRNTETITVTVSPYFESDGDDIFDNIDVDDDNDGILDEIECPNFKKPKFLNVDFEDVIITNGLDGGPTDVVPTVGVWKGLYSNIPNWISAEPAPNRHLEIWHNTQQAGNDVGGQAYSGSQWAEINATTNDGFYQDIATTPGDVLQWSFAHRKRTYFAGSGRQDIARLLIGDPTGTLSAQGDFASANDASWTEHTGTYVVPAGQTTTRLTFTAIQVQDGTGTSVGNFVDNVQLFVVPNCKDTDGDGIPDYFDLDSDNEAIPDVVEAGLGNLSEGKATLTKVSNWVDSNGNGLHDSAENKTPLDSDGDGVPNYLDLDSDNDSVFDVDESGAGNSANSSFQNGDGDITGDGVGDGTESELFRYKDSDSDGNLELFGDGILDIYDYGIGSNQYGNLGQGIASGNPATTFLKDTDLDGIPDYLDFTSNGSTFDLVNNKMLYDYKIIDANNDGTIDGTADIDQDGILDVFDTNTTKFGSPRDIRTKLFLEFDGRNDYGQSTAILGGLANASLMAWINLNASFSGDGVIIGQNNFQIRINSSKKLEASVNGTTVTYNTALNVSQWHHVGLIYDGTNIKLYLNGALVGTQTKTGAISADASLLTIGRDPSTVGPIGTKYFKGKIDEIRVFNIAISESQLRRMVYQEIQDNGGQIRGAIVPKNIATSAASLSFNNLLRYYRMDNYKDDVIDDLTTPAIDIVGAKIYNNKFISIQQAPMPFLTEREGDFSTAVNSTLKEIRGDDIMEQDWSIVRVQHNITETANNIDLGMFVDAGKNIVMNNDNKIQNDWYLKLDGEIDLVGKSQLVQTTESDLDVTSSGLIRRDQQGQANKYNYNYWSSPVGPSNTATNNNNYTVAGVMKDGKAPTNIPLPAISNINWVAGYDGSNTTPISLARYWIYKFDNNANFYANWVQIGETGSLRVGQGFTLKGSGASGSTQNYTFIGKPNNAIVNSNSVGADELLLTGNPYPSAIDADAFITDNSASIDGTLYFWEHYTTNNTHNLDGYQGGYAERNLTGGVPSAIAPTSTEVDFISGVGTSMRSAPNKFIPVGQSFFVNGSVSGGLITYQNSQRGFQKENESASNFMFKTKSNKEKYWNRNESDKIEIERYKKIRLGFNSHNNAHRQVLLGFMNEKATKEMDYGYDGLNFDEFPNDMYFMCDENQLVIQGVGTFDVNASFPIGVKADIEGKVKFMIDGLENFDDSQPIYIYDKERDTYHNVRTELYEVDLTKGENNSRFSLRFYNETISIKDTNLENGIDVFYSNEDKILNINNVFYDAILKKVYLYNTLGQLISDWNIQSGDQTKIKIPIKNTSEGIYLVKLKTTKGTMSKKIIIP